DRRESFQEYLEMKDSNSVDVTFLYSWSIKILSEDLRRKKQQPKKEEKLQSIDYNCTVTVHKSYALLMFDEAAEHHGQFVNVVAEGLLKEWEEESSR
ncbi:MAG: hypothetical protein KAJ14_00815, partial [Candidatus Omnitrophica bacterium]|nr:hypothetical protein [Candidatus Omnitrophota bacterium]